MEEEARIDERPGRPEPLARSVVATRHEVETFGKLLVSEAYQRCFPAALRKAFVADGSEANWGVWRRHFSDYVPILDFIHALTYVYAAAMAGNALKEGWRAYRQWAQWVMERASRSRHRRTRTPTARVRRTDQGDSQDSSLRDRRHVAGILAESAVADGLSRIPQARIADHEHLRGIDSETNQPADERDGEILVARRRAHANSRGGPPQRHPHARPFLAEPPPPPDRFPPLPIHRRVKSQSAWCAPEPLALCVTS